MKALASFFQLAVMIVAAGLLCLTPTPDAAARRETPQLAAKACSNPLCTCQSCDCDVCSCTPIATFSPEENTGEQGGNTGGTSVVGAPPDVLSIAGAKIVPVALVEPKFTQPATLDLLDKYRVDSAGGLNELSADESRERRVALLTADQFRRYVAFENTNNRDGQRTIIREVLAPKPAAAKASPTGHWQVSYGRRGRTYQQWVWNQPVACNSQACSSGGCAAPAASPSACSSGSCQAQQMYYSSGGCASCGRGRR